MYQRGHVEFFASPEAFKTLLPKLQAAPSLTYLAATAGATAVTTNLEDGAISAVAWGVFPGARGARGQAGGGAAVAWGPCHVSNVCTLIFS